MGILDSILGGNEKHTTTQTQVTYPDWWLNYYKPVLNNLQETYQHQQEHPIGKLQNLAYQGIVAQALGNTQQTGAAQDYLSQMMGQQPQGQTGNIPTLQSLLQGFDWNSVFPKPGQQPAPQQQPQQQPAQQQPAYVPQPAAMGVPWTIAPPAVGQPARTTQQLSPDQAHLRAIAAANSMGNNPIPISQFPYLGSR